MIVYIYVPYCTIVIILIKKLIFNYCNLTCNFNWLIILKKHRPLRSGGGGGKKHRNSRRVQTVGGRGVLEGWETGFKGQEHAGGLKQGARQNSQKN